MRWEKRKGEEFGKLVQSALAKGIQSKKKTQVREKRETRAPKNDINPIPVRMVGTRTLVFSPFLSHTFTLFFSVIFLWLTKLITISYNPKNKS